MDSRDRYLNRCARRPTSRAGVSGAFPARLEVKANQVSEDEVACRGEQILEDQRNPARLHSHRVVDSAPGGAPVEFPPYGHDEKGSKVPAYLLTAHKNGWG